MTFQEALVQLKAGLKLARKGWSFSPEAYIQLLDFNESKHIYITNKYAGDTTLQSYGLQFNDIEATDWKIVI